MATWSNTDIATLVVRDSTTTKTFTFVGVNSSNEAGTPNDFLDATNKILAIAGMSAVINGIRREIVQEAIE